MNDLPEWFDTSRLTPDEKRNLDLFIRILTVQINGAIDKARREALEEAASLHIPVPLTTPGFITCRDDYNAGHQGGQVELRQAIRALLDKEPTP